MGYSTDFQGGFSLSPALTEKQYRELNAFAEERHGGDCTVGEGFPGYYCQWRPDDYDSLAWDGGEKFYNYVEWLEYLIEHFFKPWGIKVNGIVRWQGEDLGDVGVISVKDNVVTEKPIDILSAGEQQINLDNLTEDILSFIWVHAPTIARGDQQDYDDLRVEVKEMLKEKLGG